MKHHLIMFVNGKMYHISSIQTKTTIAILPMLLAPCLSTEWVLLMSLVNLELSSDPCRDSFESVSGLLWTLFGLS